jgi:hypothetical protein
MVTTETNSISEFWTPSIAFDSNDKLHVVWDGRDTVNTAMWNIFYMNRSSAGTWGDLVRVTNDTRDYSHGNPSLDVDSSGNVHIGWYARTPTSGFVYNIHYRMMYGKNGTWGPRTLITSTNIDYQYNPNIMVDDNDDVHLVWYGYPYPTKIYYAKKFGSNNTWAATEQISSGGGYNYDPTITYDQRGYLYVVWRDSSTNLRYAYNDGTGWSDENSISFPGEVRYYYYPHVNYPGTKALKGACIIFAGYSESSFTYDLYWTSTNDFYLGPGFGPQRGIPTLEHMYRDDNPTGTEKDPYKIRLRVRDDDTGIGIWSMDFQIRNVWPSLRHEKIQTNFLAGDENALLTPKMEFIDPGTGPTETWSIWLDVDDSETWTPVDEYLTDQSLFDVFVVDNVSHVTIKPIQLPYNDDYAGTVGVYVYDDDVHRNNKFINVTYVKQLGRILLVNQSSSAGADEKTFYDWFEVQAKKEKWPYDFKRWSPSINFSQYSLVVLAEYTTSSFYRSQTKVIKQKILDQNISLLVYGYGTSDFLDQMSLGDRSTTSFGNFNRNYFYDNYAGITTGYINRNVYLISSGSSSATTIWRYSSFNGKALSTIYSSYQNMVCHGVFDRFNSSHTYNGATGDMNKGRVGGKVAFHTQTYTQSAVFNNDWSIIMNRTIKWLLVGAPNQGIVETIERTDFKTKFDVETSNTIPTISGPDVAFALPSEMVEIEIQVEDQGSDDIYLSWDWGDGTGTMSKVYQNRRGVFEPPYPPTHSALNGTAPFAKNHMFTHKYKEGKDYWLNISVWDDDGGEANCINKSVRIHVPNAVELKEQAIMKLEPLVPGHWTVLGYENITLEFNVTGKKTCS